MEVKTSIIKVNGIRLHGFHGVSKEEQRVGSWFEININIKVNISDQAFLHDELSGTVNYATLSEIVNSEFNKTSKLIENLAYRISKKILDYSQAITQVRVQVSKIAPPIPLNIDSSSIEITVER